MSQKALPVEFTGSALEYFKIWIVNILLTIVTLGFYSPWAKVRTKRYFYNNTFLDGSHFDYLADPVKILKGRLIVLGVFLLFSLLSVFPLINALLSLGLALLIPWIICRAFKFNLYNTAYRNIRFQFKGRYGQALLTFIGLPILIPFTLGLIYPYFIKETKRFIVDNSAYGTSRFKLLARVGQFYKIYLAVLVFMLIMGMVFFGVAQGFHQPDPVLAGGLVVLFYALALVLYAYVTTLTTNLVFNHTELDACRFQSDLKVTMMCWLYFSNAVAILCSVGLLIPWAKVRVTRYRLTCLTVLTEQPLDHFVAAEYERADAIGEEAEDFLDIDIGL